MMQNSKRATVLGLIVGLAVMAGAAIAIRQNGTPISDEDRKAASDMGLSVENYLSLRRLDRAKKGTEMDSNDWSLISRLASTESPARARAFMAMRALPKDSSHREEAIRSAKAYLAEHHKDGNVSPIQVLKAMDDPSWKEAAQEMSKSADATTKEMGETLLK